MNSKIKYILPRVPKINNYQDRKDKYKNKDI